VKELITNLQGCGWIDINLIFFIVKKSEWPVFFQENMEWALSDKPNGTEWQDQESMPISATGIC